MKIAFKGIVRTVHFPVSKTSTGNDKSFNIQRLIVTIPGYIDQFGERKSDDEDWELQLFNDVIDKHKLLDRNLEGKKVTVEGYLNSKTYRNSGEEKFNLTLKLADIKEI